MCVVYTCVHVGCAKMSVGGCVCVHLCVHMHLFVNVCAAVSVYFVSAFSSKSGFLELQRILKLVRYHLPLTPLSK